MKMLISISFLAILCAKYVQSLPNDPTVTYDMLYNSGVEAYLQERWYECASFMKRALEDYKFYTENLADCRQKCKHKSNYETETPAFAELQFFDNAVKRSDCIRRCKQKRFGERPESDATTEIKVEFEGLKPYDYLQICAYKVSLNTGRLRNSA